MKSGLSKVSAVFLIIIANTAVAQELTESLTRCRAIDEDAVRLGCYDAIPVGRQVDTPPSVAPVPATTVDGAGVTNRDPVVVTAEQKVEGDSQKAFSGRPDDTALNGTIVAIEYVPSGGRVVTLDNGQRWRETSPSPSLKLYVGQTVRIKPGVFGSFRLFGDGNRATRVKLLD